MILATLCYLQRNGHTLMLHRTKKPADIHLGKWNGLGGKFQAGETPEECVIREVREECGLEIRQPRLHGLLIFPNFGGEDWYVFVFTATRFEGELRPSAEGELAWIPDEELEALPLWAGDRLFLPWLKEGKFFTARFVYDGERLVRHEATFYP